MKKKIILAGVTCFFSMTLLAQYKKGDIVVGANINVNTTTNNTVYLGKNSYTQRTHQLQLEAAKAIKNNLLAGVRVGMGSSPGNSFDGYLGSFTLSPYNNRYYTGSIYLRKYVEAGKRFAFFAELNMLYGQGRFRSDDRDPNNRLYQANFRVKDFTIGSSLGVAYKISNRISLELAFNNLLALRYQSARGMYTYTNNNESYTHNTTQLFGNPFSGLGQSTTLGVKIRLGK
jgi:hypothetical protein